VQVYDLVMLIVLSMATIFGAIKGFAWQMASLASIAVSYVVAYRFRFDVAEMIQAKPPWNQFLAMLILYVGTSFVIWVGFRLLSGVIDKVRLKEFDRHLGAAFGLAKGLIFCLLITMFAMSLLGPNQQAAICQSKSGYYIASALDKGVGILPKEIHDVVGPYLANLDTKLKNGQSDHPIAAGSEGGIATGWADALQKLPGGIPNLPGGFDGGFDGLVEALPNIPTGSLPAGSGGQSTNPPSWPWEQTQPQGTNPSGVFPPPGGFQPQVFPPLSTDSTTSSQFNLPSNGLRPAGSQQAQQPGLPIPR
jgi:membrane protein required for colicin V production